MSALLTEVPSRPAEIDPLMSQHQCRSSPLPGVGPAADVPVSGDRTEQHSARLSLIRITRGVAVGITVIIAALSFVLSFSSLADLAARTVWPGALAWLWPIIIDGTIVLATMALVAFSAYPEQRRARLFFWTLLVAGAAVSVTGNAVHAMLPNSQLQSQLLGPGAPRPLRACLPLRSFSSHMRFPLCGDSHRTSDATRPRRCKTTLWHWLRRESSDGRR